MARDIKMVVFDLDGTLLDTKEDICDSMNYALSNNGLPLRTLEEYSYIVGGGSRLAVKRACPNDTPDDVIEGVFNLFSNHYEENCLNKTRVYPGIHNLLSMLKIKGLYLAVLTNKTDSSTQIILEHYFPKKPFSAVLGNRGDIPIKPRPDMGIWLCRTLNISANNALYLGDSDTDMQFAKNVGFMPVGAGWGFRGREELIYAGASAVAEKPKDLLDLLR